MKFYKEFGYIAKDEKSENAFKEYIDSIPENSIPDSENNAAITHSAFDGITHLIVPERIKYIGACAFAKNKDLKKIEIKGPAHLAQDCFNGCDVKDVIINNVVEVGPYCFWHCKNLKKLLLPNLISAGDRAIAKCENLKEVIVGKLSEFGNFIYDCPNLEKVYIGGDNKNLVSSIGINTIQLCPNLVELILSSGVGEEHCKYLQEIWCRNMSPNLKISTGSGNLDITELPIINFTQESPKYDKFKLTQKLRYTINKDGWIAECTSKKTYDKLLDLIKFRKQLPEGDSNTEISQFPDLISIQLPNYIKKIPDFCFSGCDKLKFISGEAVEYIGNHALYCTFNTETVDLPNAKKAEADAFNGCGANVNGTNFILSNLEEVRQLAFWQTGAKKLYLPKLKKVGPNAFEENAYLETIIAPKAEFGYLSVCFNPKLRELRANKIGEYAICGSPELKKVKAKNIHDHAVYDPSKLKNMSSCKDLLTSLVMMLNQYTL